MRNGAIELEELTNLCSGANVQPEGVFGGRNIRHSLDGGRGECWASWRDETTVIRLHVEIERGDLRSEDPEL